MNQIMAVLLYPALFVIVAFGLVLWYLYREGFSFWGYPQDEIKEEVKGGLN